MFLIHALAIITDADDDAAALMRGLQFDCPLRWFALFRAQVWRLNSVVDCIANHVHQWISQLFHYVAIDFRVFSQQLQMHFFMLRDREISHQTRHFLKGTTNRHHPQRHGVVLQVAGDARKQAQMWCQSSRLQFFDMRVLHHHGLRNHQFTHQVHQLI